jgi:hypothetical protein
MYVICTEMVHNIKLFAIHGQTALSISYDQIYCAGTSVQKKFGTGKVGVYGSYQYETFAIVSVQNRDEIVPWVTTSERHFKVQVGRDTMESCGFFVKGVLKLITLAIR